MNNPRFDPTQPISKDNERLLPDYATVSGILLGVVCAYLLLMIIVGREEHGAHFEDEGVAGATVTPHVADHLGGVGGAAEQDQIREEQESPPDEGDKKISSAEDEEKIDHIGDTNLAPAVEALAHTPELDEDKKA